MRIGMIALFLMFSSVVTAAPAVMVSDIGSSAETIALGHIEGFNRSSAAIFENPASLGNVEKMSLSFFSVTLMEEALYRNTSVAYKSKWGTFSYGQSSVAIQGLANTTENALGHYIPSSYFSYENTVDKFGYQFSPRDRVWLGASMTLLNSQAGQYLSGSGTNMDIGVVYQGNKADFSVAFKNVLGGHVNYSNGASESFKREIVLGTQYQMAQSLQVLGQIRQVEGGGLWSAGVSYRPKLTQMLTFRSGFQQYQVSGETRSNYAMGLGFDFKSFQFNYTYEVAEHFLYPSNHYFSLSFNF